MYITIVLDENDALFPLFAKMSTDFRVNQHSFMVSIARHTQTHIVISGRIQDVIPALYEYAIRVGGNTSLWNTGIAALQQVINVKRAEIYYTMTGRHLDVNA